MNERGRRNDSGSSLADSVQRVRQNQVTVLWPNENSVMGLGKEFGTRKPVH